MKVMRRDREEWRWIRDVAGGYGGMPHELLQHWLIRHGEKLLSRSKHLKACTWCSSAKREDFNDIPQISL